MRESGTTLQTLCRRLMLPGLLLLGLAGCAEDGLSSPGQYATYRQHYGSLDRCCPG